MITILVLMFVARMTGIAFRKGLRNESTAASVRRSYVAWERSRKVRYY